MASKNASSSSSKSPTSRTCLCSPTTHPGSFRCNLHRNFNKPPGRTRVVRVSPNHWELAVIAKANSIKAILLQIIKPSSHDMQRRRNFQPKPSRFCLLNGNRNGFGVAVT
ncbi:Serine-rich protein-related [Theobroma cacao]|uniref:Serine-rich protein-related n=1 Tax=Theobroma cacao TaxID=3641 RepID=A0A061GP27_THECC|nr:Serine-rich protein-related [Theobroma cacao]